MRTVYEHGHELAAVSLFSALGLVLSLAVISMLPEEAMGWALAQLEAKTAR